MTIISASQSRVKRWRRCRKSHDYRYNQGIVPRVKPRNFSIGSIVHEGVEAAARGEDAVAAAKKEIAVISQRMMREEIEYYQPDFDDCLTWVDAYADYYADDPLEYLMVEQELELELVPGKVIFKFVVDALVKDTHGRIWLKETKTTKKFPDQDYRYWDLQSMMYVWALRQLGYKITGVLWDYIRKKVPTKPQLLKSGGLSRKNIDTTWSVYRAEIKKHNLKVEDYQDMREKLKGAGRRFFKRTYLPINKFIQENIVREFRRTALEIRRRGSTDTTRNLTFDCDNCEYYMLCQVELRGDDATQIRRREFVSADKAKKRRKDGDSKF